MKKIIIIYFLLLSFFFSLFTILSIKGQNVTIKGQAKGAEGKIINLFIHSDQITFTEINLAKAVIDSSGKFSLNANISNVLLTYLKIDNFKTGLYIEPDKNYEVNIIPELADAANSKGNPYLNPAGFSLEIVDSWQLAVSSQQTAVSNQTPELNTIIKKFNNLYNDFVINKFQALFRSRHKAILDSFKIKADSTFRDINNKYFKDYMKYKIGSIEFMSRLKSTDNISKEYFYNKPVLYDNAEYMEFFNEFYTKFFTTSKHISIEDLNKSINSGRGDYEYLLQTLEKDTLLKNGLCEIVLLKELNDLYHTNGYNKENILYIIRDAEYKIKSERNKAIAHNLYKLLTKLKPGTKAPDFSLKDTNSKDINLKDYIGKYVYLNFWKTNIISCLSELQLMKTIYEKYNDKIVFISICADPDIKSMNSFLKDNKNFQWTFAYFNNDWDLLNKYDVKAYPSFIFIAPDGYILNYPAPKPSEDVQYLFDKTLKEKSDER